MGEPGTSLAVETWVVIVVVLMVGGFALLIWASR
jgi:hypothetical protein